MLPRLLAPRLRAAADRYPVVLLDGPRQSGKTTLTRLTFPQHRYVSLEPFDRRDFARTDPRGFLAEYAEGAIIDEVQHAPDLMSYLQGEVDRNPRPGRFILTGSQNLSISGALSQSLAGRAAILHLLPFSRRELTGFGNAPTDLFELLYTGGYPRIYDRAIPAQQWLADYVATYVERDVRQVLNIGDLQRFSTFLRMCASQTAQEINLSAIGGDAGVSYNTVSRWLSVLEASFLCVRLPAYHRNIRKQLVKAPKLHFLDSGLVCNLLGIRSADELRHHPLRGAVFESWVHSERLKQGLLQDIPPQRFHFRDARGLEVDLIEREGEIIRLIEAKSGATVGGDFLKGLQKVGDLLRAEDPSLTVERQLIYGGDEHLTRSGVSIVPWQAV